MQGSIRSSSRPRPKPTCVRSATISSPNTPPEAARRFVKALRRRIAPLKTFPEGFGHAPEARAAGVDLRQMMHGLYRVLYTVEGKIVTIHAVRHGARRPLRSDELPGRS